MLKNGVLNQVNLVLNKLPHLDLNAGDVVISLILILGLGVRITFIAIALAYLIITSLAYLITPPSPLNSFKTLA